MKTQNERPIAFVMASTNHGCMIVNRNDYNTNGMGGAYGVGYQLLNTSSFDQSEVDVVKFILAQRREHFGDGVVAIDCGANIGVHTIEWAQHMHDWGHVVSVEAQERLYYALAGNVALNNCFNATAIFAAIGAHKGEIKVPRPNYNIPSSFGSLEIRKTANTENIGQDISYSEDQMDNINLITIDSMSLPRVDFIKIDIEGMELEAIAGGVQTISRCRPAMLIERIKTNEENLNTLLDDLGYFTTQWGINTLAIHREDPTIKSFAS